MAVYSISGKLAVRILTIKKGDNLVTVAANSMRKVASDRKKVNRTHMMAVMWKCLNLKPSL